MHPSQVLFAGEAEPPVLPVCDHYAGSEALILKSLRLQAELARDGAAVFDVTADCEDGAAVGQEAAHAQMVAALLNSPDNRFGRLGVRIHDPAHRSWHKDLELIVGAAGERVAYVTVPKVSRAEQVERVIAAIDDVSLQSGIGREIPVHVLIETHGALADAARIAALPRVECLSFGLMDYVSGFEGAVPESAMASPGQFDHPLVARAKREISVACHAHRKVPSHNVCTDLSEPAAAGADARRALLEYGFTRMWSIHPSQVRPIVEALSPAAPAIGAAAEILLAAQAAGWGPIRHAGRLQDRASYRYWWGVLRRARVAGAPIPEEARRAFFAH